jgi:hypothetical protein
MVMSVLGAVLLIGGTAFAHQAGGVEVGDENASVVGQPFKGLPIDAELFATEMSGLKVWYPGVTVLDLKARSGQPIVLKVTNKSSVDRGFFMASEGSFGAPTMLKIQVVLKPGESRYIGIPTSDLLYSVTGSTLAYKDHLNPGQGVGTLLIIR